MDPHVHAPRPPDPPDEPLPPAAPPRPAAATDPAELADRNVVIEGERLQSLSRRRA